MFFFIIDYFKKKNMDFIMVFYRFLRVVRNQPFFFPFETGCLRQAWGSTCSATEILPRGSPSALVFRVGCDMAGVEHANIRAENFLAQWM